MGHPIMAMTRTGNKTENDPIEREELVDKNQEQALSQSHCETEKRATKQNTIPPMGKKKETTGGKKQAGHNHVKRSGKGRTAAT